MLQLVNANEKQKKKYSMSKESNKIDIKNKAIEEEKK